MKNIHICHVTTSHLPHDIRIFQRECRGLKRRGYKVSLVARSNKKEVQCVDGVDIVPIRYVFKKMGRKFILPKTAVKRAKALNADIYHFHDPELLPWMCMLAKQHQARIVWDVHELYTATIHEFYIKHFKPLASFLGDICTNMEKTWCQLFSGVVAVTDPLTERYKQMGLNCITVRNTIDLKAIPQQAVKHKQKHFSIVASGTTNESRCIYELLDAFRIVTQKHPDTRLKLIASFNSAKAEKQIRQHMKKNGIEKQVDISPLLKWEKLMSEELYQHNIGMVLYARSGNNNVGLPNRLFEYWACQLPVIATNTPLLSQLMAKTKGGIAVNSDSPLAIAEAICKYIDNQQQAVEAGKNGYQAVLNEFNWEHDLTKLCRLYDQILEKEVATS